MSDIRFLMLLAAVVLYGVAGTPTPDSPGLVEAVTALLLAAAAGGWQAADIFRRRAESLWERAGQALMIYGLTIPVLAGVVSGHAPTAIARDVIPFLFFMMPLIFRDLAARSGEGERRLLTAFVAGAGVLFSLRVLWPLLASGMPVAAWRLAPPADPFYLANAPTVLFAALLLLGGAGWRLYRSAAFGSVAKAALCAVAAFFPLAAMTLITQRASIGMLVAVLVVLAGLGLMKAPRRALLPLLIAGAALAAGWDDLAAVAETFVRKTEMVGLNMRLQEAQAVFDALGTFPAAVLFGRGWGASFADPAVGGVIVTFTHSLLTTFWLKTGLCGLILALVYLAGLAVNLLKILPNKPVLALALAAPVAIDVLLYASFKSLDFGLILLLIPLWVPGRDRLHTGDRAYNIA